MAIKTIEAAIETNDLAAITSSLQEQPQLLNANTSYKVSPIILACFYGHLPMAQELAQLKKDINLFEACAIGKISMVHHILAQKPDINLYDDFGFTALNYACHFNQTDISITLLKEKADPNLGSKNGHFVFPLHSAVQNKNLSLCRALLQYGAYPNVCQKFEITPLHLAAESGLVDIIITLLEHGANILLKNEEGKLPADLALANGHEELAEILKDND